ncbi:MAG TPA: hypothetical protein VJ840_15075 [Gemmatimonadaceae bacterium]|nr:hypothetical protein [Gemmatimonadaceae bacterium]
MNFRNQMRAAAAVFMTVGVVACSSDVLSPPALDDAQITADVAASSGDAIASQITSFNDNVAAAGSFSMVAPAPSFDVKVGSGSQPSLAGISPSCTYDAGRYSCAVTTENGLSVTRSFAFYNAQGATVQTWDPTVVESVNFQATVDGTFSKDLVWNASVHRTADLTVSGLISHAPQRIWNGTGTGDDQISHVGLDGIRSLTGTSTVTVTNVTMPGKDATSQIPLSGSIKLDVQYTAALQSAGGAVSKQVNTSVTVTFDGTNNPALQIGSLHCVLHLDTHSVDSCQ